MTVGYPTLVALDLSVTTSHLLSIIASDKCIECEVPKTFDRGRRTDNEYEPIEVHYFNG